MTEASTVILAQADETAAAKGIEGFWVLVQDVWGYGVGGVDLGEILIAIGDWVRVDGVVEGTVESIGFRSTLVRRFDLSPVYVPNSQLSDAAVTNFSRMIHRRIYWTIGLEYRTNIAQLRDIRDRIEAYLLSTGDFVPPEEGTLFVRVDKFSDSSIDIMLYAFTRTTKWGEWMAIKESLALAIKEIVEGAGAGFAFPSRSLYLEALPGEQPEIFKPPPAKRAIGRETSGKVAASRRKAAKTVDGPSDGEDGRV